MNRRELLKKSATAATGMGLIPGLSVLFESCGVSRERLSDYQPGYLSPEQFDVAWLLSETILPKTATPGATDAGVAPFIDLLFTSYYTENEKVKYLAGLNAFIETTRKGTKKHFLDMAESERVDYLTQLEEKDDEFFRTFKRLVVWAFFTSEVGMKSANYLPIPGRYQPTTISVDEKLLLSNDT